MSGTWWRVFRGLAPVMPRRVIIRTAGPAGAFLQSRGALTVIRRSSIGLGSARETEDLQQMAEEQATDVSVPKYARYSNQQAFDPPANTSWGKILALVPEASKVLDVGCAFGSFSCALR